MELYDAHPQKKPSTSYEVRAYIEVPTEDEAEAVAQRWVDDVGGEALVYRRRTWPTVQSVRTATYGSRR